MFNYIRPNNFSLLAHIAVDGVHENCPFKWERPFSTYVSEGGGGTKIRKNAYENA